MNLLELKEKYPLDAQRFRSAPMPDCPLCEGKGEYSDTNNKDTWCGCMSLSVDMPLDKKQPVMQHLAELHKRNKDSWSQIPDNQKTKTKIKRR